MTKIYTQGLGSQRLFFSSVNSFPMVSRFQLRSLSHQPKRKSLKDLPSAMRQLALMKFLQFPNAAKFFANTSVRLINQGGFLKSTTETVVGPLTAAFSVGETVSEAVQAATPFLANNQQLLLDYVEEMLKHSGEREIFYHEINKLLDALARTPLIYVPMKMTGVIGHDLLEKTSRDEALTTAESQLMSAEVERFTQLVEKSNALGKTTLIDQEYPHQKKAIFNIMMKLMQKCNKNRASVYPTLQATDIECFDLIKQLSDTSKIRVPAVKLVNGAYVDWAHANGYSQMIQPSKMAAFVAYVLIAKFCLKNGVHLYLCTHNPILESIIDNYAQSLKVERNKYFKGQLYGFTTKENPETLYALFGSQRACINYSLRRVLEGAGSNTAQSSPVLSHHEVHAIVKKADLGEDLSQEEIKQIAIATKFNVQATRVDAACKSVRRSL